MQLHHFSYLAVFFVVGLESVGVPLPGETALITASIYAGVTHQVNIFLIILCAAAGGITGDNIGYWIGRKGGFFLLKKYGKYMHIDDNKLKVGQYLFHKYGGRVVFLGRFIAQLRMFAAFLAGTNQMIWKRFLFANAAGAFLWSILYGYLGYTFGKYIQALDFSLQLITICAGIIIVVGIGMFLAINEKRLEQEALKAMPGSIEKYRKNKS